MSQLHSSHTIWARYQVKQGAKPRNKSGGAKRGNWASNSKNAYKSVCLVKTRDDDRQ